MIIKSIKKGEEATIFRLGEKKRLKKNVFCRLGRWVSTGVVLLNSHGFKQVVAGFIEVCSAKTALKFPRVKDNCTG